MYRLWSVVSKNLRLKRRHKIGFLAEVLFPTMALGFLMWLRNEIEVKHVRKNDYIASSNNPNYINFEKFHAHPYDHGERAPSFWSSVHLDGFLQLHLQSSNERLAIVNSSSLAQFISDIPGYENVTVVFNSSDDLLRYMANSTYGLVQERPRLFAAMVVDNTSMSVSIRMNSTAGLSKGHFQAVDTHFSPWFSIQKTLLFKWAKIFWNGGLMLVKTKVANKTVTLPLPTGGFIDLQSLVYSWMYKVHNVFNIPDPRTLPRCDCPHAPYSPDLSTCADSDTLRKLITPYTNVTNWNGCRGRLDSLFPVAWREIPFPTNDATKDNFIVIMKRVFGLFFVLAFLWPLTQMLKSLVEDKENHLAGVMRIMGLPEGIIMAAWYCSSMVMWMISTTLIVIVPCSTIFYHSNTLAVWLFFFLFGCTMIAFCAFLSCFFVRAKMAMVVGAVIFLIAYFPFILLEQGAVWMQMCVMVSPPAALAFGTSLMAELESSGEGLQFQNFFVPVNGFLCMADVLRMFVVDFVLYTALYTYWCKVLRAEDPLPWYFVLSWCGGCCKRCRTYWARLDVGNFVQQSPLCAGSPTEEPVGEELLSKRSVAIRNLRKTFGSSNAVDGVSYDLFEDQIFVLLGHNGAGKSTTVNMLTGMLRPTGGDAIVYGTHSLTHDIRELRTLIGYCPQHDVLWDNLTVYEHLRFFAIVKHVPENEIESHVYDAILDVGLGAKTNARAHTLSGGQRRRLSLAIAFLGSSKIVFLDEPTSGVDPASRREIWDTLRRKKDGRTILLTTHFMDEAEILGDRVAIMHKGALACVGNPFFLKTLYGVGYTLTLNYDKEHDFGVNALREHLPDAIVVSDFGKERSVRVPFDASVRFAPLFEALEENGCTYGVSVTTLEEVFLRVGKEDSGEVSILSDDPGHLPPTRLGGSHSPRALERVCDAQSTDLDVEMSRDDSFRAPFLRGALRRPTIRRQMFAILAKRYHFAKRDIGGWVCQVVIPLLFLLLALCTVKFGAFATFPPSPLELTSINGLYPEVLVAQRTGANTWLPNATLTTARTDEEFARNLTDGYYNHSTGRFVAYFVQEQSHTHSMVSRREVQISASRPGQDPWHGAANATFILPPLRGNNSEPAGTVYVKFGIPEQEWLVDLAISVPLGAAWDQTVNLTIPTQLGEVSLSIPRVGRLTNRIGVDIFWNCSSRDGLPIALHHLATNILQLSLASQGKAPVQFSIYNEPLPLSENMRELFDSSTSIFLALGFAFIPAYFVSFIVKERQSGAKHLQLLAGVNFAVYWLSSWIWDFLNFLIPGVCAFLLIALFGVDALINHGNAAYTFLLIVAYGGAICPFTYFFSFLFTSPTTALLCILIGYFFTGGILTIVSLVLSLLPNTKHVFATTFEWVFRLSPNFCLADGLSKLVLIENPLIQTGIAFGEHAQHASDWVVTGYDTLFLLVGGIVYFLLTLLLEYILQTPHAWQWVNRIFRRICSPRSSLGASPTDEIVLMERNRLLEGNSRDRIQILGLSKVFNGRHVVNDVTFGIPDGECFGYLGINGAGKTTTMKMLTGDLIPTAGTARLNGHDILTAQDKVRQNLGYCPQFDALLDNLTGREHLILFGRLRGFEENDLNRYATELLEMLTLSIYADVCIKHYSGGNKRKLSIGIALIADPPVLFLDEPTTGVDPVSRRWIWNVINDTIERTRASVILTTHSMDECEALCKRAAIINGGTLQCIGTLNELKTRFGVGYQLDVTLPSTVSLERMDDLAAFVETNFPDAKRLERNNRKLQYQLTKSLPLSRVFAIIEEHKQELSIQEYAVSETSIEQIFVRFAKGQHSVAQPTPIESISNTCSYASATEDEAVDDAM